jgi:hypothetical protein
MLNKLQRIAFVIALTCLLVGRVAVAQELQWDPKVNDSLVPADSSATIPPGTKITLQNWQRYKNFLSCGTQILYSGRYLWHVGGTPDFTVTVGPTRLVTLPRKFLEDNQKYGGQTKLERVDTGGFTIIGYVAGVPFPNPTEPELGAKVAYNLHYPIDPDVSLSSLGTFAVDKFLNVGLAQEDLAVFRLSHLSVAGMPINPAYGTGYNYGFRVLLTAPEEAKYTTQIGLWPDDPSLPEEAYLFLPALRRPLRLSSAARCAPILGSDYNNDDTGGMATNYEYKILGEKKILVLWHPTVDPAVLYHPDSIHIKSSLPGWPQPMLGQWELRDVYVLDFLPLPVMGPRYCYGHRVVYIDRETWRFIPGEAYDADEKLWKIYVQTSMEIPDNARDGNYVQTYSETLLNMRENHASGSILNSPIRIGNQVPPEYHDASVAAFPSSLHGIMK